MCRNNEWDIKKGIWYRAPRHTLTMPNNKEGLLSGKVLVCWSQRPVETHHNAQRNERHHLKISEEKKRNDLLTCLLKAQRSQELQTNCISSYWSSRDHLSLPLAASPMVEETEHSHQSYSYYMIKKSQKLRQHASKSGGDINLHNCGLSTSWKSEISLITTNIKVLSDQGIIGLKWHENTHQQNLRQI